MTDMADRIADCLVEDHAALLQENEAMRNRLDAYANGTASVCARAAIRAADDFLRDLECARSVLKELVELINEDKDGDFFICKEGKQIVEAAMREARK